MSTLTIEPRKRARPQTELKPTDSLNGRIYVVFADAHNDLTDPTPLADFALVPVPNSADKWNSRTVTMPVIADGTPDRSKFIDADGRLRALGMYATPCPRVRKGDSITCLEWTFRISGFDL